MKLSTLIATGSIGATVMAAPPDVIDCFKYRAGLKQCYQPTVTVHDKPCDYTACPGLAANCRAEWLLTTTVVDVPCDNKCCPTTATATVTATCQPCPTECEPLYTQTLYNLPTTCATPPPLRGSPTPTPTPTPDATEKPGFVNGVSVAQIQAGLDEMIRDQKSVLYESDQFGKRSDGGVGGSGDDGPSGGSDDDGYNPFKTPPFHHPGQGPPGMQPHHSTWPWNWPWHKPQKASE
ncbi:MAG: hypothetical protein STHCBS139747_002184 [Sporothrix thermara]